MTTEVIRTEPQLPAPVDFSPERVQLLKDTICKGATNDELRLFIEICKSKRLDPFARQIHAVKRWDANLQREVMSYQTGIDGFRLIAERTGKYEGQGPPMWCGEDGKWHDVWLSAKPPAAAKATVYRAGFREPLVRIAHYREYVQLKRDGTPTSMWQKMHASQISKCAESQALRAAFPEELTGLYTNDEMAQSDNPEPEPPKAEPQQQTRQTEEPRKAEPPQGARTVNVPPDVPADIARLWQGMTSIKTNVETMQHLHKGLAELVGAESAQRKYSEILAKYGVEHSNQFKTYRDARHAARDLFEAIKAMSQPLGVSEADLSIEEEPAQ